MWKLFRSRSGKKKAPYIPPEGRFTGSVMTQLPGVRGPSLWSGRVGGLADVIQPANLSGNFHPKYDKPDDPASR
ncbi:MAG: hypothetical protein KKH75_01665 [Actinobacteria bacterium]|nr:hypothetical protein [Actinomycetota bacterium]